MSNQKNNQWLEVFAGYKKGAMLNAIIKEEEPFVREPRWISPLHSDGYKCYHTFEIDGISRCDDFPFSDDGPLWDGICTDDISRKYLFIHSASSPSEYMGDGGDICEEEKNAMEKVFKMLNLNGDIESWYHEYYPIAKELTWVSLVADPLSGCLKQGYRCELLLFNIIDDYLTESTSRGEWDDFQKTMIQRMFGERGIPYMIFMIPFSV